MATRGFMWAVLAGLMACGPDRTHNCGAHVALGRTPLQSPAQRNHLVRIWALESINGHDFSAVTAVAVDPVTGILAVANHAHSSVVLLDPGGHAIASWSRAIYGDEAVATPVALHWQDDGLSILDLARRAVIRLNRSGVPMGETPVDTALFPVLGSAVLSLRGSDIVGVLEYVGTPISEQVAFHVLIGPVGSGRIDTIAIPKQPTAQGHPISELVRPAAVPVDAHNIAVAESGNDTLRIVSRTGELIAAVCLERADDEDEASRDKTIARTNVGPPVMRRIMVGADQRLWIQRTSTASWLLLDQAFGPHGARYDVVESDGSYVGVVTALANARLAAAHGDTVFALQTHDGERVSLGAFRIVPGMLPRRQR